MQEGTRDIGVRMTRREALAMGLGAAGAGLCVPFGPGVRAQDATSVPRAARYWERLPEGMVNCSLCPANCVLRDGQFGKCRSRQNVGGVLYTHAYGNPCAAHIDPIEKSPSYHVTPGARGISIATAGCPLSCKFCQNWQISQIRPTETRNYDLPPEKVIARARQENCSFVCYTYTEPATFVEYMLDTATLARANGLRNVWVTCGYINEAPLKDLVKVIDAVKVDLKGFTEEFYQDVCGIPLQPVLDTVVRLRKAGVWMELACPIVPTLSDNLPDIVRMSEWILRNVGSDVPVFFSRVFPAFKLQNLPATPEKTLAKARKAAMLVGLKYVYIGNIYGNPGEHTSCARCEKILVRRVGLSILEFHIKDGKCEFCGNPIPGIWS
jgi:pyruvate formate lyase activating enzyme